MAGGDSYGASLAASSSSGANQSGAISSKGGGQYGSTGYGPGSVVNLSSGSGLNVSTPVILGIVALIAFFALVFLKGRK